MKLHVGQLISAPFLPGLAEVKAFSERRGYWKLEAVLQDESRQYISQNLSAEQLAQVVVLQQGKLQRASSAEGFFLLIEAHRIRLAYQFDPQLRAVLTVCGDASGDGQAAVAADSGSGGKVCNG